MSVDGPPAQLHGTTTFFDGQYGAVSVTLTICCALALFNAIELLFLIFTTFKRYSGLYFWSLVVASAGILPYVISILCEYFTLTNQLAGEVLSTFGWPMMVTGQSLVLYSRLGVVLGPEHHRILRPVKWMIIIDGIVFHISTQVVMFGAYNAHPAREWALAYKYIEKIQMTGFTVQELIISGLYVWRTLDILKTVDDASGRSRRRRRTMMELFSINAVIIILDIALLVVEYQNRHVIEQSLKGFVYSFKLKLEFAVLRKLVDISGQRSRASQSTFATISEATMERTDSVMSSPKKVWGSLSRKDSAQKDCDDIVHLEKV
ncbi:hypothetical protein BDY17DRAFT_254507 [Neohortaea acidophila]|uniref:DUF7703 domain-containing protein n=1 Tax=Neohortaea acidophila TaxID=245834 RepID=A0A6A6PM57_9PEZI|nr:uncharacterized protein BDY17DRAFT_254507 [Neohortaea acidophila]KAF2480995.1 hypothetical protein BDY17DRAFT_254507 [Neohortaea acidophila]